VNTYLQKTKLKLFYRLTSIFVAITFVSSSIVPPTYAQIIPQPGFTLPAPGTMVPLTSGFNPPVIDGITIHPDDPFTFDFLVDHGDHNLQGEEFQAEAKKLIKYFLASLTVPEEELWVNLSPYEEDRIIPESLSKTEMGRDLLAQDYMLKQLTASLMYPENELGERFWNRIRDKVEKEYGATDLPVDTFNKVWIVPQNATVYETENTVIVIDSYLKVMLESDYMAIQYAKAKAGGDSLGEVSPNADIIKEIIIPEIEREVNEGETFANLRQIYNSMILATWYKKNMRESLLGQVYVDQNKVSGIDTVSGDMKDKIYKQYLEAFNVGVYNYIREEYDPSTQEIIPRKYFAGGITALTEASISSPLESNTEAIRKAMYLTRDDSQLRVVLTGDDNQMLAAAASPVQEGIGSSSVNTDSSLKGPQIFVVAGIDQLKMEEMEDRQEASILDKNLKKRFGDSRQSTFVPLFERKWLKLSKYISILVKFSFLVLPNSWFHHITNQLEQRLQELAEKNRSTLNEPSVLALYMGMGKSGNWENDDHDEERKVADS